MNHPLTCATRCGAVLALALVACSLVACSKAEGPAGDEPLEADAAVPKEAATWAREIPLDADIAAAIELPDGYALAGTAAHPDRGDKDMLLVRLDADGNELWRRTYGGSDKEYGYGLTATEDGGFVLCGQTSSYKDYGGDVFVVRTDPQGAEQWANSYGAVGTDTAVTVLPAKDGGFHVFGRTYQGGNGLEIYALTLDGMGGLISERTVGGADDQYLIAAGTTGDAMLLAGVRGRMNFAELRPLLEKRILGGDLSWTVDLEPGGAVHPETIAFAVTKDGGAIYAAGLFQPPETNLGARPLEQEPSDQDIYVTSVLPDGAEEWHSILGGQGWDAPRSVVAVEGGGVLVAGVTRAYGGGGKDILLIKLDPEGDEVWSGTVGGEEDELLHTAIGTADGGFLLVAEGQMDGRRQLQLFKTDVDGQLQIDGQALRTDGRVQRETEVTPDASVPSNSPTFLQENAPKVGETAPEINVGQWFNTDKPLTLAKLRGKVVVVELWATWCGPCRSSTPHLVELSNRYADDVVFLGLTDEDPAAAPVEDFIAEFNVPYPIGAKSTANVDYGVTGIPTAFVVDETGVIQWVGHPMDDLAAHIDAALNN